MVLKPALPNLEHRLDAKNCRVSDIGAGNTKLEWSNPKQSSDSATLTIRPKEQSVYGLIYRENKVFKIEPLGGGLHAVLEINQSQFPPDHPDGDEPIVNPPVQPAPMSQNDAPVANTKIRVLVAYTSAVNDSVSSVGGLIDSSIALSNETYSNSGIPITLELAHTMLVDYSEVDVDSDLDAFHFPNDMKMDEVHTQRVASRSDLCILLLKEGNDACGKAAAIRADKDSAFAVVRHTCAVDNLSFPHEIGHLQGARHDPDHDNSSTPYPFGHGHYQPSGPSRTVMAYPKAGNPNRIKLWSNPDVCYPGSMSKAGSEMESDNARVLRETRIFISNFLP